MKLEDCVITVKSFHEFAKIVDWLKATNTNTEWIYDNCMEVDEMFIYMKKIYLIYENSTLELLDGATSLPTYSYAKVRSKLRNLV